MTAMENIFTRKSIRSYNGENISETELNTILKAAYAAPVGRGMYENVHMTVVTNKEFLDKMNAATSAMLNNPDIRVLYNAPTLIIVSSKLTGTPADNVAYSNCACVVQNMALAATELEVGACHIWGAISALNSNPDLVKELNLPEGFTPCCGIILGQTDETYTLREIPENRIKTEYFK